MSSSGIDGLKHSYSVWYPKSTLMFPNPSHFKFWVWLFSQYSYQSKMPSKYPNPCIIKIPRAFLQGYLGMSRNTIGACVSYMSDIHVLKKDDGAQVAIFDAAFALGVVSLINNASNEDAVKIASLFVAGDVDGLRAMGYHRVSDFSLPTVGGLISDPPTQNLDSNFQPTQNLVSLEPTQNLVSTAESTQNLVSTAESTQNLVSLDDTTQNLTPYEYRTTQILGRLYYTYTNFCEGEVLLSFRGGLVDKISVFDSKSPQKGSEDLTKIWAAPTQILTKPTQILTAPTQILDTVNNIVNKEIIKINQISKSYDELEIENRLLKEHINVLLEKNQNSQVEADASVIIGDPYEIVNNYKSSHVRKKEVEQEVDDDNDDTSCYNIYGEWVDCTVKEKREIIQAKLNDPNCQLIYRTIKNELEEGQQISGREFKELIVSVVDEILVAECSDPETGEFVERTYESFLKGLGAFEELSPEDQEEYGETFKIKEIIRFCKKEYRSIFPHFKFIGRVIFVHFQPQIEKSEQERIEEFEALHSQYDHTFTPEQIALPDYEKRPLLIDRFRQQFPEKQEYLVADMVEAMRNNMIDIGLFSMNRHEYNSYSILIGFEGFIQLKYDIDGRFAEHMKWRSLQEIKRDTDDERYREMMSLKAKTNNVVSDSFDYGKLLEGFKRPRIKLTSEGDIPAKPALVEAFKYLEFFDGKILDYWELEQICNCLLRSYNHLGTGIHNFHQLEYIMDCDWRANKFTIKNIGAQPTTEPASKTDEEVSTYVPKPRDRRRPARS